MFYFPRLLDLKKKKKKLWWELLVYPMYEQEAQNWDTYLFFPPILARTFTIHTSL